MNQTCLVVALSSESQNGHISRSGSVSDSCASPDSGTGSDNQYFSRSRSRTGATSESYSRSNNMHSN